VTGFDVVLTTAEVRWFARGGVPSGLHTWFIDRDVPVTAEPARVDHYLLIGDTDALGISCGKGASKLSSALNRLGELPLGKLAWARLSCGVSGDCLLPLLRKRPPRLRIRWMPGWRWRNTVGCVTIGSMREGALCP
jgi:hypothetical protein